MQIKRLFNLVLLILLAGGSTVVRAEADLEKAELFSGHDLHLAAKRLISYQRGTGKYTLVFPEGFSGSVGANEFSCDKGAVWLESVKVQFRGRVYINYNVWVYLAGNVSIVEGKGAGAVDIERFEEVDGAGGVVLRFSVDGEVFATADKREVVDQENLELYGRAFNVVITGRPEAVLQGEKRIAELPEKEPEIEAAKEPETKEARKIVSDVPATSPAKAAEKIVVTAEKKPSFMYPVNISPAGEADLEIEEIEISDGTRIATIMQRFFVWQKQDEKGGLIELEADSGVVFRADSRKDTAAKSGKGALSGKSIKAVYLAGDVVLTEGSRTIRADEVYYDFPNKRALVINAVMRSFDTKRGIPVYVRAAKLRQLAANQFAADNITLTSSEFYQPQLSLTASKVIITDTTAVDEQLGKSSDSSYDAQMKDVRLKAGKSTIFYWPFMRSNMQRPDIPLKSAHVGYDKTFGTSVETKWHLSRLLGLREPEGVDSSVMLDYFGKRGLGGGFEIDYKREDYYGRMLGYLMHDSGEDRLGRTSDRKDIKPPRKLRGRFQWLNRHYLPYNWQLTTGISYSSDEDYIEQYFRSEYSSIVQETYAHMKRIESNWALSFLGKGRINDYADVLEQLPSAEFHLTGQSIFDDMFTLYSDTQISRTRQRIGNEHSIAIDENMFSFVSHRTELDLPLQLAGRERIKVVPFVAGTIGYDGRSGFSRSLVDGSNSGSFGQDQIWIAEGGVRIGTDYWKVYPNVKSRLWDLNQIRHIIRPQLTAVLYEESDLAVKQRDTLNLAVSQRLQTKRATADDQSPETIDWMRLDVDFTWVKDSDSAGTAGDDRFIWNRSGIPLRVLSAPEIFNGDFTSSLQRTEMYGPRRNYFGADYIWRVSDTTAVLSGMNFDLQSSVVQQFNFGFSRMVWPDLSYYVGSRYLRRMNILGEKGTNPVIFAAMYRLDPRYTLVFSQQYDFDYGKNIRNDIALIRKYHRMRFAITYSADNSLDNKAIVFSIWPQGIPELSMGQRKYMKLGETKGY